eukprot:scaffold30582_cov72-Phaeocystis_antarctica.AAC.1
MCWPIKHEVGRQLRVWVRPVMSTPCSTRSRHVAPDDVGRESPQLTRSTWSSRGSRLGASWPGLAANRYTSSSDQLRAALLKLRPAGRRDRHGWRRTPPCPVWG